MSDKVTLDPLALIGILTINTPAFVVEYVSRMCKRTIELNLIGIDDYYNDVISTINSFVFPEIDKPSPELSDSDFSKILKFISPFQSSKRWDTVSILEGYNHMCLYDIKNDEIPAFNKSSLVIGDKIPENPFVINQIIAYIIASINKYQMNRYTTFDEVKFFIMKLSENRINSIKNSLLHTINSMSPSDILKIYYSITNGGEVSENESELTISNPKTSKFSFETNVLQITW